MEPGIFVMEIQILVEFVMSIGQPCSYCKIGQISGSVMDHPRFQYKHIDRDIVKCNGKTFIIQNQRVFNFNDITHLTIITSFNLNNVRCRLPLMVTDSC